MSGEDRFHLENISFHLPKGYILRPCREKTEQARQLFTLPDGIVVGQQET